jgi:hypothetical protein
VGAVLIVHTLRQLRSPSYSAYSAGRLFTPAAVDLAALAFPPFVPAGVTARSRTAK